VIPVSVQEGSAKLSGIHAENEQLLVAVDVATFNVRKATCSPTCIACVGMVSASVVASPFATSVNGTTQLNFTVTWNSGAQYNLNGSASWSSGNTSIATVAAGLVTGKSVGAVTVSVSQVSEPIGTTICSMSAPICPIATILSNPPGKVTPTISSIDPDSGQVGTTVVAVNVNGSGFGTAPTLSFSGSGISPGYITQNDSLVKANFIISISAPIGAQDVRVVNNTAPLDGGNHPTSNPVSFTVTPPCPSTVTAGSPTPIPLAGNAFNQGARTGVGNFFPMTVGGSAPSYNGAQITEAVTAGSATCPSNTDPRLMPAGACIGSSTFTVGTAYPITIFGQQPGAIDNVFWDAHGVSSGANTLTTTNSCTATCRQVYSCGSTTVGNFTITFTYTQGTLNGQPVTFVNSSKQ
jgi:hypothetical protein